MPHVMNIQSDYMQEQYKWLEELVKKSSMPSFEPSCTDDVWTFDEAVRMMKE